jgi:hypothetical protein
MWDKPQPSHGYANAVCNTLLKVDLINKDRWTSLKHCISIWNWPTQLQLSSSFNQLLYFHYKFVMLVGCKHSWLDFVKNKCLADKKKVLSKAKFIKKRLKKF